MFGYWARKSLQSRKIFNITSGTFIISPMLLSSRKYAVWKMTELMYTWMIYIIWIMLELMSLILDHHSINETFGYYFSSCVDRFLRENHQAFVVSMVLKFHWSNISSTNEPINEKRLTDRIRFCGALQFDDMIYLKIIHNCVCAYL